MVYNYQLSQSMLRSMPRSITRCRWQVDWLGWPAEKDVTIKAIVEDYFVTIV